MSEKSNKIKPSEVSQVLLSELQGIDLGAQYAEVGTVLQVSDGVVRIFGLRNAEASELLEFDGGMKAVVMNLEEDNVGAVLLGPTDLVKEGDMVRRTGRTVSIDVSESMLGRVINPLGEPIDGGGEISGEKVEMPLDRKAPGVIFRQASADRSEGHRCDDTYRTRTEGTDYRRPSDRKDGHCRGHHHQSALLL